MLTYFLRRDSADKLTKQTDFTPGTWIHVETPTKDEIDTLVGRFDLDRDLIADALDPDEIPRLEKEGNHLYLFMRRASRTDEMITTSPVVLVIAKDFVVSLSSTPILELSRPEVTPELITSDQPRLILALAGILLKTYEQNVNHLTRSIRAVRTKLTAASISNRDFVRFVVIEDSLNEFLSDLVPFGTMFGNVLTGRHRITINEDDHDHAEDLLQNTQQLIDTTRGALKTIVNIREAYSNIMTNDLNRQMKLLTSLTVVLTIPTMLFSLYGMNVPLPGQTSSLSFHVIVGGAVLVCALIIYMLFRRKWL